jgi:hypothetical protein
MGGGLLQLVAYGAQDIYLTGNPQITFFKIVYRRHTNFSMECIRQTISGSATISDTYVTTGSVIVSRNGDLLSQIYVRCDQDTTCGINGDYLVEDVEIEIGGQRMDKQFREWHQVWTELSTPVSKSDGLKYLSGGFKNTLVSGAGTSQQSIMYPLQFWFCRNVGLAIPLIALQYHDVKLKFNWGSGAAGDGMSRSGAAAVTPAVEVWCDYIYLDTDERRRFAQVSHEYLIEQLQLQVEGSSRENFKLNFDHPIKELIWTVPTSSSAASTIITQKLKVEINGHDRFAYQDREYFQIKQPMVYHTAIPGYNIKETENPTMLTLPLEISQNADVSNDTPDAGEVFIAAESSDISVVTLGTVTSGDTIPKVGDILLIAVSDASGNGTTGSKIGFHSVTVATSTTVFSVTPGLPATTSVDNVSISIVGRTQLPQSRCSQLDRDVFVYSFALNPEDHQPSGACNFSRIESAKFLLSAAGTISNIYALNYNVLRIMSGMGGLAYAI